MTEQEPQTIKDVQSLIGKMMALNRFIPLVSKKYRTFQQGEELYAYLGQSETAISGVLSREENRKQKPVFYISRVLQDAEQRYGPLEQLVLSLLNVSRKLKHYFDAHPIVIFTDQPLKSILSKPDITGRAKWAMEIAGYNLEIRPETAKKAKC